MRTLSDFWVVCRKSGHRRFFVILTQKNANFAEINGQCMPILFMYIVHSHTHTLTLTHTHTHRGCAEALSERIHKHIFPGLTLSTLTSDIFMCSLLQILSHLYILYVIVLERDFIKKR